jgi:hypothetical protein
VGEVHFFVAHGDYPITSTTDEKVSWYPIERINTLPVIENLKWLIPLALDEDSRGAKIDYFQSLLPKS